MKFSIVPILAKTGSAGVQSYSHALGETPKLALFLLPAGQYDDLTEGSFLNGIGHMTFGATDGVRSRCGFGGVIDAGSTHTARRAIHTDACVVSYNPSTDAVIYKATFSSWNSATFSLNWLTPAPAAGNTSPIYVILFSGDDFNARVDHGAMRTTAGTQDYTGVDDGKALITWNVGAITSVNALIAGMGLSLGFVDEAGNARARSCFATDTSNDIGFYSDTGAALLANNSSGAISAKAAFVSHNPAGAASFRLNFTTPASAAWQFIYIHLGGAGLKANAGHFITQPNNTINTPGNNPRIVLFSGNGVTTVNAGTVGDIMFSTGISNPVEGAGSGRSIGVNVNNASGICSNVASIDRALIHALNGGTSEENGIVPLSGSNELFKTAKSGTGGDFVPFYLALGVPVISEGGEIEGLPPNVIEKDIFTHPDGTLLENTISNRIKHSHTWLKRDQMGVVDFVIQDDGATLSVSPGGNTTYDGYSCSIEPDNDEYWAISQCKHLNNNSSGNHLTVHVRADSDVSKRTFYRLQLRTTDGNFEIQRFVEGAQVEIAGGNVGGQVPADTIVKLKFYTKIDENGDVVLEGYYNDALILSAVDSDVDKLTWRGRAGIGAICGAGSQVVTFRQWQLWTG